jgi:hypothetical protein
VSDYCSGGPDRCFGYRGPLDTYTCLADNHDMRTEDAAGRQPCQADDKRWADLGWSTCRFHRQYDPEVSRG